MNARHLLTAAVALLGTAFPAQAHTVTASSLRVRTGPGFGYATIAYLSRGTVVTVVGRSGAWSRISSPRSGWCYSAYLANTPHSGGGGSSSGADFVWPISGRVTSTYWTFRGSYYHRAIDIAGPSGTPVGAARGGSVIRRGWAGGYGILVVVSHSAGYTTYYGHNSRLGAGGSVGRLATIAYRGTTGQSTGPHVHFEVRRWGAKTFVPSPGLGGWITRGVGIAYNYPGL